ncbi:MAG TPA: T9SS type A sorting domain-containing protein [Flavobacteriales bacterium]|nr:T9SS type A sorting domain-containing protein [Flavobacteriales bacterium]
MKRNLLLAFSLVFFTTATFAQPICNPSGNIVIFSNYDGGVLNIDVDVNIPNLKIGIVSYEAVTINLSGTYLSNLVEIMYAGYNSSPSTHCSMTIPTTTISGVPGTATSTINTIPAATMSDPDGYPYIICSYQCVSGPSGGCNTPDQVVHYFVTQFGGSLYSHETQYGCWSGTQSISGSGNCCIEPAMAPVASFSTPDDSICVSDCVTFTDMSSGTPTGWAWTFAGGTPSSSTLQNPTTCYNGPGTFMVTLDATNGTGTDSYSFPIVVSNINAATTFAGTTITATASGASYQWIDCNNSNLPIAGATSQSYTATANGSYAVIVTNNDCSDTSSCTTISTVGLNDYTLSNLLSIYPNPTNGLFTIDGTYTGLKSGKVTVLNVLGEPVYTGTINSLKTSIDLSGVMKGIYFVRIETATGKVVKKITRE